MTEHIPTEQWHVTVWRPSGGHFGEVAGIMSASGQQRAVILGGPDGVSEEDIERANQIVREHNSHDALLAALERLVKAGQAVTLAGRENERRPYREALSQAQRAIAEAERQA